MDKTEDLGGVPALLETGPSLYKHRRACINHCKAKGFLWSALEYGWTCICGDQNIPSGGSACYSACHNGNNNHQVCLIRKNYKALGGADKFLLFKDKSWHLLDLRDPMEDEDDQRPIDQPQVGDCMGQMKNEEQTQIQDNNPAQCIKHCRERGFKFAGVQGQRCRYVNQTVRR